MGSEELKEHAKATNVLDMETYLKDESYHNAMEDYNLWIHGAMRIEQQHIIGMILANDSIELTKEQQESLEQHFAQWSTGLRLKSNTEELSEKEKLKESWDRALKIEKIKIVLGQEVNEIANDEEDLEEFPSTENDEEEMSKFSQAKKLEFGEFQRTRRYRNLMRTYNPYFQDITLREQIDLTGNVLEWLKLSLSKDQMEAIVATIPEENRKSFLKGTGADFYLAKKAEIHKKIQSKKGGDGKRILTEETQLPAKLQKEFSQLQEKHGSGELSSEEYEKAKNELIDRYLPNSSGGKGPRIQ